MKLLCLVLGHDYDMHFGRDLEWYFVCSRCEHRVETIELTSYQYRARGRLLALATIATNSMAVLLALVSLLLGARASTLTALVTATLILSGSCIVAGILLYRTWSEPSG